MRCIAIQLADGGKEFATELIMAPQGLVLLGQVLADNVGLSTDELIWIGSPSWVVAGVITSSILDAARRKVDERRIADIQRIAALAQTHSQPITEATISGLPTSTLSLLEGFGSPSIWIRPCRQKPVGEACSSGDVRALSLASRRDGSEKRERRFVNMRDLM